MLWRETADLPDFAIPDHGLYRALAAFFSNYDMVPRRHAISLITAYWSITVEIQAVLHLALYIKHRKGVCRYAKALQLSIYGPR